MCSTNNTNGQQGFFPVAGSKSNPLYPGASTTPQAAPSAVSAGSSISPLPPASGGASSASDLPLPKKENLGTEPGAGVGQSDEVTDFQTTHYGYKDDPYMDSYTAKGEGKFGKLRDSSVALTDSMAKKMGIKPGEEMELKDKAGNIRIGTYDDRAPQKDNRIDLYNPKGSQKAGEPFIAVSARVVRSKAKTMYANNK